MMVARFTRETCPQCHREFQGFGLDPAMELVAHQKICPPPDLLEAMREVDAMLPDSPPIAPPIRMITRPAPPSCPPLRTTRG
jgi:hypothetical protein